MTTVPSRRVLACLLLLAFPAVLRADETVELRWRFTKDQVLKYLMKHRETRTAAFADQKFATTTDTEYEWQWTVTDIDDKGTATLEQKLTALRVNSTGKDWDFQYDSSRGNDANDEYKKKLINFYDQVRFTTYRLKLKPDGTVADVYGFDKLLGEIGNTLATSTFSIADFEALNLRDASFGWYLQQLLGTLPSEAAAKGSRWNQPVRVKLADFGELNGRNDFTLGPAVKAGDRTCREIKLKGEQTLELGMKWLNNTLRGPLKTSRLTGTSCFDAKQGRLVKSEVQVEMGGELKLGDGDKPAVFKLSFEHALELEARP